MLVQVDNARQCPLVQVLLPRCLQEPQLLLQQAMALRTQTSSHLKCRLILQVLQTKRPVEAGAAEAALAAEAETGVLVTAVEEGTAEAGADLAAVNDTVDPAGQLSARRAGRKSIRRSTSIRAASTSTADQAATAVEVCLLQAVQYSVQQVWCMLLQRLLYDGLCDRLQVAATKSSYSLEAVAGCCYCTLHAIAGGNRWRRFGNCLTCSPHCSGATLADSNKPSVQI